VKVAREIAGKLKSDSIVTFNGKGIDTKKNRRKSVMEPNRICRITGDRSVEGRRTLDVRRKVGKTEWRRD
jgi:hypothetical protein